MRPSLARRAVALVATVIVSVGLVTGCTDDGGSDDGGSGGGQRSSGSFTPGVQQLDLNEPVVAETFAVPGSDQDTVTVGVLGLEHDDKLQVLHLAFTPNFASEAGDAKISLGKMIDYHSFSPWLVDRTNLKVYNVVDDFRTETSAATVNGQPMYVYAVFAAPQNDDNAFEVRFNDVWQPFVDIESVEK